MFFSIITERSSNQSEHHVIDRHLNLFGSNFYFSHTKIFSKHEFRRAIDCSRVYILLKVIIRRDSFCSRPKAQRFNTHIYIYKAAYIIPQHIFCSNSLHGWKLSRVKSILNSSYEHNRSQPISERMRYFINHTRLSLRVILDQINSELHAISWCDFILERLACDIFSNLLLTLNGIRHLNKRLTPSTPEFLALHLFQVEVAEHPDYFGSEHAQFLAVALHLVFYCLNTGDLSGKEGEM